MFYAASAFNQDLSKWNVGKVTNMQEMFAQAQSFNKDLSKWDVGKVTDMEVMFYGSESFNQDVSKWDVGKVTDMESMFNAAERFNQDLSKWNVGQVTNMNQMFNDAQSFDKVLRGDVWIMSKSSNKDMFKGSSGSIPEGLSPHNRDDLKKAVDALSPVGDCPTGMHPSIGWWDVSRVTDMRNMFS